MIAVILTIHILAVAALIGVVLLQRSEGGALFGGGGFMTGRGAANALTRTTMLLAAIFFSTSLALAVTASHKPKQKSLIEDITAAKPGAAPDQNPLLRDLGAPAKPETAPAAAAPAPTDSDLLGPKPAAPGADAPADQTTPPAAQSAPASEPAAKPADGTKTPN